MVHILHDSKVEDVNFSFFHLVILEKRSFKKFSFDGKINRRFCPKINLPTKGTSTMTKTQVP
jgi:hypothetical protein